METEEINERVAKLMDWHCTEYNCDGVQVIKCGACGRHGHGNCYGNGSGALQIPCYHRPDYAGDIAQAWKVVEKLREVCYFRLQDSNDGWQASFDNGIVGQDKSGQAEAPTAPLAICLAALKAVGVSIE